MEDSFSDRITRRRLLRMAAVSPLALQPWGAKATSSGFKDDSPRVFYSNDTTHILSCESPYRGREDRKSGFNDKHLQASIAEARGADVHLLQPGLGWIPWWNSKIYSPRDHYVTFLGEYGVKAQTPIARYLLAGGDMIRTHVDHCRNLGVLPFVSYRLNDGHHVRGLAQALDDRRPTADMSRHFWENYTQYRIGPDPTQWDQGVFNWMIPEVRDHKFALIQELCTNYDIAGLELDFLRHWSRFSTDDSTADQRRKITMQFVRRIRTMLNATSCGDRLRTLCIRVPAQLDIHDHQGIDLPALAAAGVNVVALSWSYFTMQDDSVRRVKQLLPHIPVMVEMTHTTLTGKAMAGSGTQPYLRTTDQQFYTTAHLAYEQGSAGVSLFNFPYYRAHKMPELGPFHEPPFHVLPKLKDRAFLARQPQWYFLSAGRRDPVLGKRLLPTILQRNVPQTLPLEMSPTAVHRRAGVLRLRSDEPIADREIEVRFNGVSLKRIGHVAKPLPHPHDAWLGRGEEYQCFAFPAANAKRGTNRVEVVVKTGIRVRIIYLDVSLPT